MNDIIYLLLGGNTGDRLPYLDAAEALIGDRFGEIVARSATYETAAWGMEDQQPFLNRALGVRSSWKPLEVLAGIHAIEAELDRERIVRWGPRTIDIDIILFGSQTVDLPSLKIPHPLMQERRFVLVPMAEIAPAVLHPGLKKTMLQLLEECTDPLPVTRLQDGA